MARLDDVALGALGVERNRLIDTPPTTYDDTVQWAQHIYGLANDPEIAGIRWNSRKDPAHFSFVFFEGRVDRRQDLDALDGPTSLDSPGGMDLVTQIADDHDMVVLGLP